MTYAAYSVVQQASETPRELEMRAVAHMTTRLERSIEPGADQVERVKALYWNDRMWSIFIDDLSAPDNQLPEKIRGTYVSLGLFVRRATVALMDGRGDIAPLIRINRDLLEALDGQAIPAG